MTDAYARTPDRPLRRRVRTALVVLALAGSPVLSFAQENLLTNAGFEELNAEDGAPLGWTAWATPNQAVFTLAAARTGVACAAITDDASDVSQGLRSPRVGIEAGKTYRARVWVSIERLEKGGFALYLEYWRGGTRVANKAVSASKIGEWQDLSLAYPAPEDATEATVLIYGSSTTVGRAYFDDASLLLQ